MKSVSFCLLIFPILTFSAASAQRLKRADRLIVANMQAHISYLNGKTLQERKAGTSGEKLADEYIRKQFERSGLRPKGDGGSWYQTFELYDGKQPLSSTYLTINSENLTLLKDFFPFSFSADRNAEGSVAIALAESGFPWFKDLRDIIEDENTTAADVAEAIRNKAQQAAKKGATALIVYNGSGDDIGFDGKDSSDTVTIPVLYITHAAFKKYLGDENATADVKLNVKMEEKRRTTHNVVGYADNGADSIIVAEAGLADESNIAALLELARLSKNIKPKKSNYLFIAYSEEENGSSGMKYFTSHYPVDPQKVNHTVDIDSISKSAQYTNGLNLVKHSMEIMKEK